MMTQTATSDAPNIAQSYLQMPYNQYVWVRKEFMEICADLLEAMILRVVEYEIEGDRRVWVRKATEMAEQGKATPEEPEWWITLSHKQIITRLYGALKNEKTLRAKLKSLVEDKKFLLVRDNPDNHYGAPQYTINKELIKKLLGGLPPLPGIKEAAKSQANPLPETVPPTRNGTPYQSRQEGGVKTGTTPLPETVPATSQNRQGGPTKTGRTNKNDKNSKNSNKNSEERMNAPVSSPPTNSFIQSSSLEFSHEDDAAQGDATNPPDGVGMPDSPADGESTENTQPISPDLGGKDYASSGLRIAPRTQENGASSAVSPSQSAAVMQNDTEVDETIASLDQLRFWLKHLGVHGSSDAAKKTTDLEKILPRIKDKAALESLIAWSGEELFRRYGEYRRVFVGNLADQVEAWWAVYNEASQEELPWWLYGYVSSPFSMSGLACNDLRQDLWNDYPDFAISRCEEDGGLWGLVVFMASDCSFEIGSPDDVAKIPRELLCRATWYGRDLREQQQSAQTLQAVGM